MENGAELIKLKVLNPSNEPNITEKNAKRLDILSGKTICEVMHSSLEGGGFRATETFPAIREMLQKRFPEVKIVPYSEFPAGNRQVPYPYWIPTDKIGEVLKERGCDAVILGNAG